MGDCGPEWWSRKWKWERKKKVFVHVQGSGDAGMHAILYNVTRLTSMGEGLGNLNPHESIQEAPFQPYELSSGKRIL
jgi:hypothetical protein